MKNMLAPHRLLALAVSVAGLGLAAPLDDAERFTLDRRQVTNASRVAFYPPASGGGSFISQSREREGMILIDAVLMRLIASPQRSI